MSQPQKQNIILNNKEKLIALTNIKKIRLTNYNSNKVLP